MDAYSGYLSSDSGQNPIRTVFPSLFGSCWVENPITTFTDDRSPPFFNLTEIWTSLMSDRRQKSLTEASQY